MIFLSHKLTINTPLYGGSGKIEIEADKAISCGDSCNTSWLQLPNHAGTHVDAPRHFLPKGKSIDAFSAQDWIFTYPKVIDVQVEPGELVQRKNLEGVTLAEDTDFVIFRTGFEKFRNQKIYWQKNPGLAPDLAEYLADKCPQLRGVGMDFISISSFKQRAEGRKAHYEFLKRDVLLFEDMKLSEFSKNRLLKQVIALPLRFENADGAPVTILGDVG